MPEEDGDGMPVGMDDPELEPELVEGMPPDCPLLPLLPELLELEEELGEDEGDPLGMLDDC